MERFLKVLDFSTSDERQPPAPASNASLAPGTTDTHHLEVERSGPPTGATLVSPQRAPSPPRGQTPQKLKDVDSVKAVRLLWCDTGGVRRCRVIPSRRYASCQSDGMCITCACMAMPAFADCPAADSGLSAVGEARMKPVEATRVDLPWCPGHQMALVEFSAPRSEAPWDYCPRSALRKTCQMLLDNFGITVKVGFEIEFVLLQPVPPGEGPGLAGTRWRPVDSSLYCQSSALDKHAAVLDEMVDALEAMGIEVLQWHAESGHGQYEVALSYGDAVESADKLLLAREALVGVAGSRGLAVSFLPKPHPDMAGSGCHVHLSLWKDGKMHMHVPSTPGCCSAAAAGILTAATHCPQCSHHHHHHSRGTSSGAHFTPDAAGSSTHTHNHTHTGSPSTPHSLPQLPTQPSPQPGKRVAPCSSSAPVSQELSSQSAPQQQQQVQPPVVPPGAREERPMPSPSPVMQSFLAGMLNGLEVLLPFTCPSPNSYARLRPGTWAGAHAAWGYNNREVPLRLTAPGPSHLDKLHIEYKSMDNTANPYIALSALLVAGMLGLFSQMPLPEPCQVPPADLDKEAAARLGVRPLPASLSEALAVLKDGGRGDTFTAALSEAIGTPLLKAYLAVRQAEAAHAPNDQPANQLLRYS